MKKILLIVVPLISLLVLAGAGLLIYTQVLAKEDNGAKVEKVGPILETEEFTVNVSQATNRYIKAKFALEVSDEKALKELEGKKALLQDKIIMVLSSQSVDELSTVEGKEACKKDIIKAVNSFLEKGEVTKVYFTNIIFS